MVMAPSLYLGLIRVQVPAWQLCSCVVDCNYVSTVVDAGSTPAERTYLTELRGENVGFRTQRPLGARLRRQDYGSVALMVERRFEAPRVVGSNPT